VELVVKNTGEVLVFTEDDPEALFVEMADYLETEGPDAIYSQFYK
jgi:hypothetical protein